MSDCEKIRSYIGGYKDGENGIYNPGWDPLDDLLPPGFESGPSVDVEAYDEGYKHGRQSVSSGK